MKENKNVEQYYDKELSMCIGCKHLITNEDDFVVLYASFKTTRGNWFTRNFRVQKFVGCLHKECFVDFFIRDEIGD